MTRVLRWGLIGMIVAPFLPWSTLPFPAVVLLASSLTAGFAILVGRLVITPIELVMSACFGVSGVLLPLTAVFAYVYAREGSWRKCLLATAAYLCLYATLLGAFLISTAAGPTEPLGGVSPLAALGFFGVPVFTIVAKRWIREREVVIGMQWAAASRLRLRLAVGVYVTLFLAAFAALYASAIAAIDALPVPRWQSQVRSILEGAETALVLFGIAFLVAVVASLALLVREGRSDAPRTGEGNAEAAEPSRAAP